MSGAPTGSRSTYGELDDDLTDFDARSVASEMTDASVSVSAVHHDPNAGPSFLPRDSYRDGGGGGIPPPPPPIPNRPRPSNAAATGAIVPPPPSRSRASVSSSMHPLHPDVKPPLPPIGDSDGSLPSSDSSGSDIGGDAEVASVASSSSAAMRVSHAHEGVEVKRGGDEGVDISRLFSNELCHQFSTVSSQTKVGLTMVSRMAKFSEEMRRLYGNFGSSLQALVQKEVAAIHKLQPGDEMQSSRNASLRLLERCGMMADAYRTICDDMRTSLVDPLTGCFEAATADRRQVNENEKAQSTVRQKAINDMFSLQKKAKKMLEEEQTEKAASSGRKSGTGSHLKSLSEGKRSSLHRTSSIKGMFGRRDSPPIRRVTTSPAMHQQRTSGVRRHQSPRQSNSMDGTALLSPDDTALRGSLSVRRMKSLSFKDIGSRMTKLSSRNLRAGFLDRFQKNKTALEACTEYNEAVVNANFIQRNYLSFHLPAALSKLQQIEECRMEAMKSHLAQFSTVHAKLESAIQKSKESVSEAFGSVDPIEDLKNFVKNAVHLHGTAPPNSEEFTYDLPKNVQELEVEAKLRAQGTKVDGGGLFGGTLDQVMLRPENAGLAVPKVVTSLCEQMEKYGALDADGIFRMAASGSEVHDLKLQFLQGNYTVASSCSPHALSTMLKTFMRDLSNPVIPETLYDQCVTLAQKDSDAEEMEERLKDVFSKMPVHNQRLLVYLSEFLEKVVAREDKNRMNAQNLAIVFSPGMLRNPSKDPMSSLKNTQFEVGFLVYFFKNYKIVKPLIPSTAAASISSRERAPTTIRVSNAPSTLPRSGVRGSRMSGSGPPPPPPPDTGTGPRRSIDERPSITPPPIPKNPFDTDDDTSSIASTSVASTTGIFGKHTPSVSANSSEAGDFAAPPHEDTATDIAAPKAARSAARSLLGGGGTVTRKPRVRIKAGAGSIGGAPGGLFSRLGHAKLGDDGDDITPPHSVSPSLVLESNSLIVPGGARPAQHRRVKSKKGLTLRKKPGSNNPSMDMSAQVGPGGTFEQITQKSPVNRQAEAAGPFDDFPLNDEGQTVRIEKTLPSEDDASEDDAAGDGGGGGGGDSEGSDESLFGKQTDPPSSFEEEASALASAPEPGSPKPQKSRFRLFRKSRTFSSDEPFPQPSSNSSPKKPSDGGAKRPAPIGTPETPNAATASSDARSSSTKSKDAGAKPKSSKKGGLYSLFTPKTRKHNMLQDDDSDNEDEHEDKEDSFTFGGDHAKPKSKNADPFAEFEDEMGLDFDGEGTGAARRKPRRQLAGKADRLRDSPPRTTGAKGTELSPVLAAPSSTLKRLRQGMTPKNISKTPKGTGSSGKAPKGTGGAVSKTPKGEFLFDSLTSPEGDGEALLSSNPFDDY